MTVSNRVKELFVVPRSIHEIEFVEELGRAVERPKATAETYVTTPEIVSAFEGALGLVATALRDKRSQAAFLNGSYGSGKSHFMALVSLLLEGNEHAWRIADLHPLKTKYDFAGKAKLLQLRFHFVGHEGTVESAIFRRYIGAIRERHPDADLPALFADEGFFDDARSILDEVGDDRFFGKMNAGLPAATEGAWGDIGASERWDRARFDAAVASIDPDVRGSLFNALAKTWVRSFADENRRFIDMDQGLFVLARHAKKLGYDGVVLFLDELIVWFMSRVADRSWFHNEVQKIVKLVEAQESNRDIPIISIIPRQRDLAEIVGADYAGVETTLLRDSLRWAEERFVKIELKDKNLPAVVEKRVLKPKDETAGKTLEDAFKTMKGTLGDAAWRVLLGELDEKEFRRLYPFSPTLMDALVAISASLQKQRTAIRLLSEMLVEHVDDLELGDVVGIGDLFDIVAGGTDSTDGIMRARFDAARQLYSGQFLPVIQRENKTDTPEKCQRLGGNPARIGCSNCRQKACRADNRLIKTILLAALLSERPAFRDLTASRLVQLNHGSIRLPIEGAETALVAAKLQKWASSGTIAQLHVGNENDPTVRIRLEGVDPGPILKQAELYDTPGARQKVLRDMLFDALGVGRIQDTGKEHVLKGWRGTDRYGFIHFGNVRKMNHDLLLCDRDHDWRLVIDYPFDDDGFGPTHDEQELEKFLKAHAAGTWTVVWLPTFFSKEVQTILGDLARLEHILSDAATTNSYISHLSVENQERAKTDLSNLRMQKQSRLRRALEEAYGITKRNEGNLDLSNAVEKNLHVLKPGATVRSELAPTLGEAVDRYAKALVEARYPLHPSFPRKLTRNLAEELVKRFGEIVDAEEKHIVVGKDDAAELKGYLGELGLVRVAEDKAFVREDDILQRLDNTLQKKGVDPPDAGTVRSWIDETAARGLQPDALDLIIRCYARWSSRALVNRNLPYEHKPGYPIPDHILLKLEPLPTRSTWMAALTRAGEMLAITFAGRACHGDNVKRLENEVNKVLKDRAKPASRLAPLLEQRIAQMGIDPTADRLVTARSADELCRTLAGKDGKAIAEALAAFDAKTSPRAIGESLGGSAAAVTALEDELVWGPLEQLRARTEIAGADAALDALASALRRDELFVALGDTLRALAKQAQGLLKPKSIKPPPIDEIVKVTPVSASGRGEAKAAVEKLLRDATAALEEAGDDVVVNGSIRFSWKKKS